MGSLFNLALETGGLDSDRITHSRYCHLYISTTSRPLAAAVTLRDRITAMPLLLSTASPLSPSALTPPRMLRHHIPNCTDQLAHRLPFGFPLGITLGFIVT
jgi:hypothetical protein